MPRWTAIGTGLFCPAAISPRSGQVGLFTRAATGELVYQERDGLSWTPGQSLGVPVAHTTGSELAVPVGWQLAACRGTAGHIEVFASSPQGDLLHMSGMPGACAAFECIGSPAQMAGHVGIPVGLTSPPAACSSASGRLDVFALGQDGELLHTRRTEGSWGGFESLGCPIVKWSGGEHPLPIVDPVAACMCGDSQTAVFLRGVRGDLLLKWWDGHTWSPYASLGSPEIPDSSYPAIRVAAPLTGPPAACSWGPNRIDAFARGPQGDIFHKFWDGAEWSGFQSLGMPVADDEAIPLVGAITACTSGVGNLDVVTRGVDGRLYHAYWDGAWEHESRVAAVAAPT